MIKNVSRSALVRSVFGDISKIQGNDLREIVNNAPFEFLFAVAKWNSSEYKPLDSITASYNQKQQTSAIKAYALITDKKNALYAAYQDSDDFGLRKAWDKYVWRINCLNAVHDRLLNISRSMHKQEFAPKLRNLLLLLIED